jgi:hypothetical protein
MIAKEIEEMAIYGSRDEEIATAVGYYLRDLQDEFGPRLKRWRARFKGGIRKHQFESAAKLSPAMLIHLGKYELGQNPDQAAAEGREPEPDLDAKMG